MFQTSTDLQEQPFQKSSKSTFQKDSNLEENWKVILEDFWKLAELEDFWKVFVKCQGFTEGVDLSQKRLKVLDNFLVAATDDSFQKGNQVIKYSHSERARKAQGGVK